MSSSGKISKHRDDARQYSQALAASADYELSRAMAQSPGQRKERLVNIANKYDFHIPTWIALADEHLGARRLEEARYALNRARRLDPHLDSKLPPRLRELRCPHGISVSLAPAPPVNVSAPPRPASPEPRFLAGERRDADKELAAAFLGDPGTRMERLVRVTRRHPRHAPAWLALAEEQLAGRRVEEALYAYNQALTRDPGLADRASQSLARAWRYHRASSNTPHAAGGERPAGAHGVNAVAAAGEGAPAADKGRGDQALPEESRESRAPAVSSRPGPDDSVDARLAQALDQDSRYQRVVMLRKLFIRHRNHPAVLFHFAIESALAGNEADARYAAVLLKREDPEQHELLLQVARGYWPEQRGQSPVHDESDCEKLTGVFLVPDDSERTVIVDPSALRPRWVSPASLETVVAPAPQQPVALLCEQCWAVFGHDGAACPDSSCRAARASTGWRSLPYRFRDRFLFVELLGRGDMGAVFRARDSDGQAGEYAVKVLRGDLGGRGQRARLMFDQEVSAAGLLGQHRSFVNISALDVRGAQPFLVMELVSWPTLRAALQRSGPLDPGQVARLGSAILDALECMHAHQMVHRDLKPENVFLHYLDSTFTVKIAGHGRWMYDARTQRRGVVIEEIPGALEYASPEQTRVGPLTTASDIHAVGSMLWEAAVGWVPFPASGHSPSERLNVRYQCSRVPPERPAGMDPALHAILSRALSHDPAVRQSASQMRYELDALAFHLRSRERAASHGRAFRQPRSFAVPGRPAKVIDERRELLYSNKFLLICLLIALMLFTLAIIISIA